VNSSKQVQAKVEQLPSTEVAAWGAEVNVGTDLIIPKLLLMQGMSDAVTEGKAGVGEWRDSVNHNKFGSITESFEVVPFHVTKHFDIEVENDDGKFEWVRTEPIIENPSLPGYNDQLPWTDKEDGKNIKRIRRLNFYVLIPKEVEEGTSIPYVVSFKSTALKEGQKMLNQMYVRNLRAKLTPASYKFKLSVTKQENDKGKWFVPVVELGGLSNSDEIAEAHSWFKTVTAKGSTVKVDESDVVKGSKVAAETGDF
jgi:hypothetical protein